MEGFFRRGVAHFVIGIGKTCDGAAAFVNGKPCARSHFAVFHAFVDAGDDAVVGGTDGVGRFDRRRRVGTLRHGDMNDLVFVFPEIEGLTRGHRRVDIDTGERSGRDIGSGVITVTDGADGLIAEIVGDGRVEHHVIGAV